MIQKEYRFMAKGPYLFLNGPAMVYRIKVETKDGKELSGWIKIGHWFFGLLFSKDVEDKYFPD